MIRKLVSISAAVILAASSMVAAAPAHAATKTIYTQCVDGTSGKKLTKKSLSSISMLTCRDLSDLSALKGAKNLYLLHLESRHTLKIKGSSKLKGLKFSALYIDAKVSDPKFTFLKDFPNLGELDTGPTNATSLSSVASLKQLSYLQLSTKTPVSFTPLNKLKQPLSIQLKVSSGKVNLASLARLPKLDSMVFTHNFKQSVSPLKKSKSLTFIGVYKDVRKKLTKGQKYVLPKPVGKYSVMDRVGWKNPTGSKRTIVSNGVGALGIGDRLASKTGKLSIDRLTRYEFYTPGKMNFAAPLVGQRTARVGTSLQVDFPDTDLYNGWNDSIGKCTYQWQRNKKNIKGARTTEYTASRADIGKTLRLATTCEPFPWLTTSYGFTANTKYSGAVKIRK